MTEYRTLIIVSNLNEKYMVSATDRKCLALYSTAQTNLDSVSIKSHPIYFSTILSISASLRKWQT